MAFSLLFVGKSNLFFVYRHENNNKKIEFHDIVMFNTRLKVCLKSNENDWQKLSTAFYYVADEISTYAQSIKLNLDEEFFSLHDFADVETSTHFEMMTNLCLHI